MGENNATELMTVNRKVYKRLTERSHLDQDLATVRQKRDELRERQRNYWRKTLQRFLRSTPDRKGNQQQPRDK